jgi:hypothetical protein
MTETNPGPGDAPTTGGPTNDRSQPTMDPADAPVSAPRTAPVGPEERVQPVAPAGEPRQRRDIPAWLQAIAALLTVGVSAVALILGLNQVNPGPSSPPAGSAATGPQVEVTGFTVSGEGIEVSGWYRALRPAEETLYLVARPREEPDRDWLPVRADLRSTAVSGEVQDGDWSAFLPVPAGAEFAVQPLVLPGVPGSGATSGQLELVRAAGARADGVISSGAETVVER